MASVDDESLSDGAALATAVVSDKFGTVSRGVDVGDGRADAIVASCGDVIGAECDGATDADFESEFFFLRRTDEPLEPRRSDFPPAVESPAPSSCVGEDDFSSDNKPLDFFKPDDDFDDDGDDGTAVTAEAAEASESSMEEFAFDDSAIINAEVECVESAVC